VPRSTQRLWSLWSSNVEFKITLGGVFELTNRVGHGTVWYGHFLLDMLTRLNIELPLDAGHVRTMAPITAERHPPVHIRRGRRAKGQQLALF